ncbi:putative ribonuclease H-like domain-containing protein [Tanacetum coccineum]
MWDAIKSRFGGNDESKKMQKYILKQQFEGFSVSNSEGLHKGYDRFQSLLSQLEIHGAGVSTEDPSRVSRSLPSSWSQVSLVMRTKTGVDNLSIDDLYNNLRVFESDIKGSNGSYSSAQNVAFVSSKSTNSTNDVSTAYEVSTSFGYNSQSGPYLDHEDLEQLDEFDLEETDLKWQVAMISLRLKKFYKKTGRKLHFDAKEPVGFDKTIVECYNCVDWTNHAEDEQENFALMAYSNSGSYTEVEAQLVTHQKNQLWYEEKIRFMKIDLDDKTGVLTYHKKLLAEAVKEKEELITKLENFQSSSKGLSKLLNSQMSKRDKYRHGYGDQVHDDVLSYENKVFQSVFDSRSSDVEDSPVHDRFENVEGMHAVPSPMTGNYMPLGPDMEVDDSIVEILESVPEPVVVEPKVVSQPKVWSDAPIIEEYESDSDDEYVIKTSKEQEKPSFAFVNTVKHVKTPRETVKEQNTCSQSPKVDKRDWNGLMSKRLGLGYGFTKKACFVCGSFGHLIRDCDFHEKRMAKQFELNKQKGKATGQGENRPVWNNVQRLNHQNKFVPKAVLTKTGIFPVNAARQNPSSQAAETSTARKVNTARPIVNEIRQRNNFYKSHSPIRRPFNKSTAPKANFTNHKVNTAGDKIVSAVRGYRETADDPQKALKNKGIVDSGCSRHMTGNKAYLVEYQDYNGGPVAFGGSKGYISGKGKIKTGKLDFEDVCFVKELQHFNLFSVSQMCEKKNKVLFIDTECLMLSPDFKLPNENQVLLRVPRQNNMYSFNLENIVPTGGLACLIAKATVDESNKWHIRLGHVNFKNLNKHVKGNLVRGLPSKIFQNDHTYVACQKGKQHKASWIKREYSNARIPQQNGVAERKNKTLIEAARTMLADSSLPNTFWAKAVSIACYVLNRVLVIKPQNKTPYELITGKGPNWLFDLDYLTDSMNYQPVTVENKANKTVGPKEANHSAGTQDNIDAGNSKMEAEPAQEYFVLPLWSSYTSTVKSSEAKNGDEKPNGDTGPKTNEEPKDQEDQAFLEELERLKRQEKEANDAAEAFRKEFAQCTKDLLLQAGAARATSTNTVNTVSTPISTASPSRVFSTVADFTNLETTVNVSPIPTSRIHSIHPTTQILGDPTSAVQTRSKVNKSSGAHAFIEPKKISQALEDKSWVDAMQEELLQFKIQKGYRQEEGIDYDEVFAPVARIEAIRIFLAFASYMGFIVYQMDVKSAFLYGTTYEEVYVSQAPGFVDLKFSKKVYKVIKALYGLHQAPRAWYATLFTFWLRSRYKRRTIDKTLFIKKDRNDIMLVQQKEDGIFISQDKYVVEILKKFNFDSVKTVSTPIETQKPLIKDEEAADVDVHLYRSMIGSLMYLTASRPDIMFAFRACSRFQVTPKTSHIHVVKRIFWYLKDKPKPKPKPKLGLWYPRVSSFDLEAYSDSDYAGANLDRKSTTGGCQFLGRRLISWQCKKQTIVATSTTEAEYVAAANCYGQVLWIQNQMLDYGFNFMNTKIYIDNERTICIVKNLVFHSKTKHIEIRHHFIRDAYEKKII